MTLLIDSLTVILLVSSKNYQNQLIQEIPLEVPTVSIKRLLELISKHHQLAQSKLFIKFLVTLLLPPVPYTLANDTNTNLTIVLDAIDAIKEPFLF